MPGADLLKAVQELLQSRTVLGWGNEGGFFVAVAVDLEKVLGRKGFVIHFAAKLKWNNGILVAVDDQDGSMDFLQAGSRIKLSVRKQANAWKKPE